MTPVGSGAESARLSRARGRGRRMWPPSRRSNWRHAPERERDALFAAWLEGWTPSLRGAAQVWLIEDVHWAGGDVLALHRLRGGSSRASGAPGD